MSGKTMTTELWLCKPNKTEKELHRIIYPECICEDSKEKHQCILRAARWTTDLERRLDCWTDNMRKIAWHTARIKNGRVSISIYEGEPYALSERFNERTKDTHLPLYEMGEIRCCEISVIERLGFGAKVARLSPQETIPAITELLRGSAIASRRLQHTTDSQIEQHVRKCLYKYVY